MFARVGTITGDHVKEVIDFLRKAIPPKAKEMKAAYVLKDDKAGKVMTITLWETKEALDATADSADKILKEVSNITGVFPVVEVFEVGLEF